MKAWHFVGDRLRDGRPIPPDGEWLFHQGKCAICQSGLHASKRIIDALKYAPGATICRVKLRGIQDRHNDKVVATHRKILWRVDGEKLLREFARKQALSVIDLWDAPDIVRQYLETGDESKREAAAWAARGARDAAEDAAWAAAWDASRGAAWDAARTAWDAAWAAARAAANDMLEDMVRKARK